MTLFVGARSGKDHWRGRRGWNKSLVYFGILVYFGEYFLFNQF
jgi:hypothetical protein